VDIEEEILLEMFIQHEQCLGLLPIELDDNSREITRKSLAFQSYKLNNAINAFKATAQEELGWIPKKILKFFSLL